MAMEGPFSKEAVKSGVSKKEAFKLIPKIVLAFDKICRERRQSYLEELKNSDHNSNHNPHIITHDFKIGKNDSIIALLYGFLVRLMLCKKLCFSHKFLYVWLTYCFPQSECTIKPASGF
ncbi:MAG: hypothetical protein GY817_08965 [bacterium]|nr:hypothetical protein [bacterium]